MWANAQRNGRPAEYRWRPLFNAAKFGWRPLLECRAVTLPKRETRCWNYLGCPKLTKRSQPLVGRSSPYCEHMWRRYCCLTSFFPIVDMCLAENTGRKKVAKNRYLSTIAQLLGYIFTTKALIDNRKKLVKQQYLLNMSSQYGELLPTSSWDRFVSLGHPR